MRLKGAFAFVSTRPAPWLSFFEFVGDFGLDVLLTQLPPLPSSQISLLYPLPLLPLTI